MQIERIDSGLIIVKERCVADLEGVPAEIINDPERLKFEGEGLAEDLGLSPVDDIYHVFPLRDGPNHGATGGKVLEESHLIWSSWPERRELSIDIHSCSKDVDLDKAPFYIYLRYRPDRIRFARVPQPPYIEMPN